MTLNGRHLKVAAVMNDPWVLLDTPTSGQHSGILINMMNNIAGKLNFTYSVITPIDQEWGGEMPNGSFTGMIGMCQRKEADIALGPFALAYDRFQVADHSTVTNFDDFVIMLPRPRREVDLSGVAKPLAWKVWMFLAIAICLSFVTGYIINQITMYMIKTFQCEHEFSLADKIKPSWVTKVISAEVVDPLPNAPTGRIYLLTWMIGGFILQAAYSSVLISLLAVPKVPIPVDSLEDLIAYGKQPYGIYPGAYFHGVLQKSDNELYKKTLEDTIFFHDYPAPEHYVRLKRDRLAVISIGIFLSMIQRDDYIATAKCNYYMAKRSIFSVPFALAYQKQSELKHLVDKWIVAHVEAGILRKPIQDMLNSVAVCMMAPGTESGSSLKAFGFMDLSGIFLLYGVGVTAGIVFFISEMVLNKSNIL